MSKKKVELQIPLTPHAQDAPQGEGVPAGKLSEAALIALLGPLPGEKGEIKVGETTVVLDPNDLSGDLAHIEARIKTIRKAYIEAKKIYKSRKQEVREKQRQHFQDWKNAGKSNKVARSLARAHEECRAARYAKNMAEHHRNLLHTHLQALQAAKAAAKRKPSK